MGRKMLSRRVARHHTLANLMVVVAIPTILLTSTTAPDPNPIELSRWFLLFIMAIFYPVLAAEFLGSVCFGRLADLADGDRRKYLRSGCVLLAMPIVVALVVMGALQW